MSESLNVIALISGGKDSLFSLLHCIAHGHKIVALANLQPSQSTQSSHENSVPAVLQTRDQSTNGEDEVPDLNSFMYQTVGYSLIPLYASALQIPLYRRPISGTSIQQSQYYDTSSPTESSRQIDETEDLTLLLQQIISVHPEANAVSTGAILSTYQRTRIESIALRLHLTPIGYLWQYPVLPAPTTAAPRSDSLTALLDDMATSGLEACIIKIASAGIPEKCLFSKVTDSTTRTQLVRGLTPFFQHDELGLRGAVLGEGGEYETLALSGPRSVWKGGRIEVDESSGKSFVDGGVTYMKFGRARLVPHHVDEKLKGWITEEGGIEKLVPVPGLLDPQFVRVKEVLEMSRLSEVPRYSNSDLSPSLSPSLPSHCPLSLTVAIESSTITINNITESSIACYLRLYRRSKHALEHESTTTHTVLSPLEPSPNTSDAGTQIQRIVDLLPALLYSITPFSNTAMSPTVVSPSLSVRNITSTTVLLSSMADFPTINPIYSNIWPLGLPSPPARVTISTDLPQGVLVSMSLVLHLGPYALRRGLHVQGRSYWAPANIGPYSQAVAVPLTLQPSTSINQEDDDDDCLAHLETVNMAGQIPLIPSSMSPHQGTFLDSCILSLQHLWRVGQERGVDIWPWGVAYLATGKRAESFASFTDVVWGEAHIAPTWASSVSSDSDDEEEDDDDDDKDTVDIWHLQHNRAAYHGFGTAALPMTVGKHLHLLPNHQVFNNTKADTKPIDKNLKHIPPLIAMEIGALPRNACVEWWSTGIAGLAKTVAIQKKTHAMWRTKLIEQSSDRNKVRGSVSCLTFHPNMNDPQTAINFVTYLVSSPESERTKEDDIPFSGLPVTPSQILDQFKDIATEHTAGPAEVRLVHGTAFVCSGLPSSPDEDTPTYSTLSEPLRSLAASMTMVPCRGLWGRAATTREPQSSALTSEGVRDPDLSNRRLAAAFVMRIDFIADHN